MMILGKQKVLYSIRILSAISVVFLCLIFFQILSFDNTKSSNRNELEIKYDNKLSCVNNSFVQKPFWESTPETCNDIQANFGFLYSLSESRLVYYSFALFLGGVINVNKIIKVGVF